MRTIPFLSGLAAVLFSVCVQAEWYVFSGSDGHFVVEKFERAADGWQDRTGQWVFPTEEEADRFLKERRGFSARADAEFGTDGNELRGKGPGAASERGVLWTAKAKWDLGWEEKFSQWVATDIDAQFWVRHKVATDCADALYSLRWIFARMHGLEMVSKLSGSGDYFTHRSLRDSWSRLPTAAQWHQDKRFLAALDYLLRNTYTHSLMADSYPIRIDRESVKPGVYHLDLHDRSGHTQIIHRTDENPGTLLPFLIVQSTVPRKVRELSVSGFWYSQQPRPRKGGLLRMRWPQLSKGSFRLAAPEGMPFYSTEQYAKDFLRKEGFPYNQEVYLRLNPDLDFQKVVDEAYGSIRGSFRDRVQIVEDGYKACSRGACPPNSSLYDEWSTPSRDGRIGELILQVRMIQNTNSTVRAPDWLQDPFLDLDGEVYSLQALIAAWTGHRYSSEPADLPDRRWGVSSSAIRDWSKSKATSALRDREAKLRANKSSAEEDQVLMKVRSEASSYCATSPERQCREWLATLEKETLSVRGDSWTLRALFERAPWFFSNPSDGLSRQWGEQAPAFTWMDTSFFDSFQSSSSGFVATADPSGSSVWDVRGKTPARVLHETGGPIALAAHAAIAVHLATERTYQALDLESGASVSGGLPFAVAEVEIRGNAVIFLDEERTGYLLAHFRDGGWTWIDQGRSAWPIRRDEKGLPGLITGAADHATLWDFSGETPRSFRLPGAEPRVLHALNDEFAVAGTGVVDKSTGSVVTRAELALSVLHPGGRTGILMIPGEPMRARFFTLDARSAPVLGETLAGFPWVRPGSVTFWSSGAEGDTRTFLWSEKGFREIRPLADEKAVEHASGDLVISSTKTGSSRLRRGSTTIFEVKGFVKPLMNRAGEAAYVEVFDFETGAVSVRTAADPAKPIQSQRTGSFSMGREEHPDLGVFTSQGHWLL